MKEYQRPTELSEYQWNVLPEDLQEVFSYASTSEGLDAEKYSLFLRQIRKKLATETPSQEVYSQIAQKFDSLLSDGIRKSLAGKLDKSNSYARYLMADKKSNALEANVENDEDKYLIPFDIRYYHPSFISRRERRLVRRLVQGQFEIILANRYVQTTRGEDFHSVGYTFHPGVIISTAYSLSFGDEKCCFGFHENDPFELHFNPVSNDRIKIFYKYKKFKKQGSSIAEFSQESDRVTLPRIPVIRKLIDCYRNVCVKNDIKDYQKDINEVLEELENENRFPHSL